VVTAGRQVQSQASRRWRTGSDPTATTAGIIAVAYLAMYPATCSADSSPASSRVMLRTSSCSPQRAYRSGPSSRGGHGTVTAGAARRRASSSRPAVNGSGGGARQPGQRQSVAASRRRTAWKWIAPRRWSAATTPAPGRSTAPAPRRHSSSGRAAPQARIVLVMAMPAARPQAVGAASTLPVRPTGQHQPALRLAGVDPAEAGGGDGHEQPWMLADRLWDALAAFQAGGTPPATPAPSTTWRGI
jgi:hypothetical protein